MDGWVQIRGLRCQGRQGVTAEQRAQVSEYLVDVAWRADIARAVSSDDVTAAVDIAAVAERVRGEIAVRPRALVERMTADVAWAVLGSFAAVDAVRVRIEKQHPDGLRADAESVELVLERETS